jgi:transketolase
MRKDLGEALANYGHTNNQVVVLDADVSSSTMTKLFAAEHPKRFFNVGIAEPGMIDTAVGLALAGKIPFVSAFAAILSYRGLEQIRTCVAYNNVPVKLLSGYSGVSDYKDGPTHHSLFDLAVMRAMPNMTVVVPADGMELKSLVAKIGEYPGPVYLRISRADLPYTFSEDDCPVIGKGRVLRSGSDLTIMVTGTPLNRVIEATRILENNGIDARVVELHTLKPLDDELIFACAEETEAIVTVEEHTVIGGLFGAVSETLARQKPTPVEPVGIRDAFAVTGPSPESLWDWCGLRPEDIAHAAEAVLKRKGN